MSNKPEKPTFRLLLATKTLGRMMKTAKVQSVVLLKKKNIQKFAHLR